MKNLFNQVAGKMVSSLGGHGSASPGLLQALVGMFGREQGGPAAIVKLFQDHGLGETVKSWTGSGPNQPVSADQVRQVFGEARVKTLGEEAGLAPDEVTTGLASLLPNVMDSLTPDGTMPEGGALKKRLSALAGKLL
ncbi:MAG: DUF937 domain-containing protein [Gemmatimonadales bacterium]|nr:DUF937 domain-containing protein [Gemmatimonadales bacterium]